MSFFTKAMIINLLFIYPWHSLYNFILGRSALCSNPVHAPSRPVGLIVFFRPLAALHLWHQQSRRDDGRRPDHRLWLHRYWQHGKLRDSRKRRTSGANAGSSGSEQPADHRAGEAVQRLREHLDRHPRYWQVLQGCLSRCLRPLQHHLLVHLLLTRDVEV